VFRERICRDVVLLCRSCFIPAVVRGLWLLHPFSWMRHSLWPLGCPARAWVWLVAGVTVEEPLGLLAAVLSCEGSTRPSPPRDGTPAACAPSILKDQPPCFSKQYEVCPCQKQALRDVAVTRYGPGTSSELLSLDAKQRFFSFPALPVLSLRPRVCQRRKGRSRIQRWKASGLEGLERDPRHLHILWQDAAMSSAWPRREGRKAGAATPPGTHTYALRVSPPCPSPYKIPWGTV